MERIVRCQGAVLQGDQILLVNHRNLRTGAFYWWLPGGGLQEGETPEEGVVREIREETHLEVRLERLLFERFDPQRRYIYERYATYLCTPTGGELAPGSEGEDTQSHTILEVGWFQLWDETGWEYGFYAEHMLPLLKQIQQALSA